MNEIAVAQNIKKPINLNWKGNPSIQKLLDVVVSILAEEYIQIAKQNSDVFSSKNGDLK